MVLQSEVRWFHRVKSDIYPYSNGPSGQAVRVVEREKQLTKGAANTAKHLKPEGLVTGSTNKLRGDGNGPRRLTIKHNPTGRFYWTAEWDQKLLKLYRETDLPHPQIATELNEAS
jgi:hypothetical protein